MYSRKGFFPLSFQCYVRHYRVWSIPDSGFKKKNEKKMPKVILPIWIRSRFISGAIVGPLNRMLLFRPWRMHKTTLTIPSGCLDRAQKPFENEQEEGWKHGSVQDILTMLLCSHFCQRRTASLIHPSGGTLGFWRAFSGLYWQENSQPIDPSFESISLLLIPMRMIFIIFDFVTFKVKGIAGNGLSTI